MTINSWYSRPVFISSTFKDMQAERDYLRDVIFPELTMRLANLQGHLEPIDLRWGIETVNTKEQQDKELLVLKVCLNEIKRSRPFLIVLLGDRYGWIPPKHRMKSAIEENNYHTNINNKSVTHLEIEFGILDSPEQYQRSFFYLRDPLPYEIMPKDKAALYSDEFSATPSGKESHARLLNLKKLIETDKKTKKRVRHYSVKWEKNRVIGLEAFGQQVLFDLWSELESEYKKRLDTIDNSWEGQERRTLEEFVEMHSIRFTGREDLLFQLIDFSLSASTNSSWGTCISGESGSGKSALFARLKRELQSEENVNQCKVLAHSAGISNRSSELTVLLNLWIQELALYLGVVNQQASLKTIEEKIKRFQELLSTASSKTSIVCMIDAVNEMERSAIIRHMSWIPEVWPQNARLIVTTTPGQELEVLGNKRNREIGVK